MNTELQDILSEQLSKALQLRKDALNKQLLNAIAFTDLDGIKKIVEAGADINYQNQSGTSAIHGNIVAGKNPMATTNYLIIFKYLLEQGADFVNLRDNQGKSAYDYAIELKREDAIALYQSMVENNILNENIDATEKESESVRF